MPGLLDISAARRGGGQTGVGIRGWKAEDFSEYGMYGDEESPLNDMMVEGLRMCQYIIRKFDLIPQSM